ncbi:MAG: UPF0149 family protein [Halieaceae bacterium]|nr:UPF0149 family protein [Halieaceae bacterium]
MSTNSRGEVSQFDFEDLANQLMEQGHAVSPADLHGCLCGLLAAGGSHNAEAGLQGLDLALGVDLHGELAEQVMALHVVTAASLEDDEFDFYPLLLDDNADLASRTAALAGWCRSFLAGYAQGSGASGELRPGALPGDSSEVLADLAAIAQADLDEIVEDEESERSYAELSEYIRFAALNAYLDTIAHASQGSSGDPAAPRLH